MATDYLGKVLKELGEKFSWLMYDEDLDGAFVEFVNRPLQLAQYSAKEEFEF